MARDEQDTQETEGVDYEAANAFWNGQAEGEESEIDEQQEGEEEDGEEGQEAVEVRIKGRTVLMTPEDAAAYQEFVRETRERDGRLGGELAQLRERLARNEGALSTLQSAGTPTAAEELAPPSDKLALEDWAEYHRQMTAWQARLVQRQASELEARYAAAEAERTQTTAQAEQDTRWVTDFYTEYNHLDRPELKSIVRDAYVARQTEIDALPQSEAHALLAELAQERILQVNRALQNKTDRPPRTEGAGRQSTARKKDTEEKPMSGEAWMRRKRAQLRGEKVE